METLVEARFITAEELARRWSMHRDTVYKVPTSELPYMKLGPNTRRYRIADVEAYERASRVGGVAEGEDDAQRAHALPTGATQ